MINYIVEFIVRVKLHHISELNLIIHLSSQKSKLFLQQLTENSPTMIKP